VVLYKYMTLFTSVYTQGINFKMLEL